jgi:hypothetical protein
MTGTIQLNHADASSNGTWRFLQMLEQSWEGKEFSEHDEAGTQWQSKEEMDVNYKQENGMEQSEHERKVLQDASKAQKGKFWNLGIQETS